MLFLATQDGFIDEKCVAQVETLTGEDRKIMDQIIKIMTERAKERQAAAALAAQGPPGQSQGAPPEIPPVAGTPGTGAGVGAAGLASLSLAPLGSPTGRARSLSLGQQSDGDDRSESGSLREGKRGGGSGGNGGGNGAGKSASPLTVGGSSMAGADSPMDAVVAAAESTLFESAAALQLSLERMLLKTKQDQQVEDFVAAQLGMPVRKRSSSGSGPREMAQLRINVGGGSVGSPAASPVLDDGAPSALDLFRAQGPATSRCPTWARPTSLRAAARDRTLCRRSTSTPAAPSPLPG
jgi:hypothetical protein